jgi:hypothetical protein
MNLEVKLPEVDELCAYLLQHPAESIVQDCATLSPAERRQLTLALDRRGLVVVKMKQRGEEEALKLTASLNQPVDLDNLTVLQLRYISDLVGTPLPLTDPATASEDLQLLGFDDRFLEQVADDLRRFGVEGLVRRDRIVEHEAAADVQATCAHFIVPESVLPADYHRFRGKTGKLVYSERSAGKCFVSVDLRAAVFFAFRDLARAEEPGSRLARAESWTEYLESFTSSKTLARNKALRLRVFGKLKLKDPGRLWQNRLWGLWQDLHAAWPEAREHLVAFEHDEFILQVEPEAVPAVLQRVAWSPDQVRVQAFRLHALRLEPKRTNTNKNKNKKENKAPPPFFVRQHLGLEGAATGSFDVKCVPGLQRVEALRVAQAHLAQAVVAQAGVVQE